MTKFLNGSTYIDYPDSVNTCALWRVHYTTHRPNWIFDCTCIAVVWNMFIKIIAGTDDKKILEPCRKYWHVELNLFAIESFIGDRVRYYGKCRQMKTARWRPSIVLAKFRKNSETNLNRRRSNFENCFFTIWRKSSVVNFNGETHTAELSYCTQIFRIEIVVSLNTTDQAV